MVLVKFAPLVALTALLAAFVAPSAAAPQVHSNVHRALRAQGTVNLIISMKEGTEKVVASVKESDFADRGQKIASLVESLERNSQESQKTLANLLSQEASSAEPLFSEYKSFWISNQVYVKDATFELLEKLVVDPSIASIIEEPVAEIPHLIGATAMVNASNLTTTEWGLQKIKIPEIWATGNIGQNVVVGTIDSGVISTHEILKDNFRSSYNWFDPQGGASPYDSGGHGTFTAGILVGSNGVGVAPGATLMTCKGCTASGCVLSDLLKCAEFMTCPTDPAGNNKDCSKAPHLVSNSWVYLSNDNSYQAAVNAWHAVGIIPIFGIGNNGDFGCDFTRSPGDLPNVIGVGATDSDDLLAPFSSKGPGVKGQVKPDISAPGVAIHSAWGTNETSYRTASGTSAATPHVAGVVALLLNAKPGLNYEQVKNAIISTADTDLKLTGESCGTTPDGTFPNNNYGYGRINAVRVLNA
ncbi:hypothetical protein FI667_g9261, partial [Globisporangium splendens]